MNSWKPISLSDLHQEIEKGIGLMTNEQLSLWHKIALKPEKWIENENGDLGGGFWIVAIVENKVIWYNDIEDGFNISKYSNYGEIDEYWANDDELQWIIHKITHSTDGNYT